MITDALVELAPDAYARQVLPLTHELWANGRTFEAYVDQTVELARTGYGKRYYRTLGLRIGKQIVASFKRYDRHARLRGQQLAAMGIGAVFTPAKNRGRGYASVMLATALDRARSQRFDFAYLFSDIHPQFYKALGFVELSSRLISFRADALSKARIDVDRLQPKDWPAIRRCFDATEQLRNYGFVRGPLFWTWLQTRIRHGSEHAHGQAVHLGVRRGRGLAAYVLGQREPKHDAYVLDEFGVATPKDRGLVEPLLRAAAGDLRRITGWLPPASVRSLLPRGSVRKRKDAVFMIAPLSPNGTRFLDIAKRSGAADAVWSTDHI
ncbi:MAG TPA: GNAT family N-acetyltransferase [Candidatus Rubrimentiphilum sp.]|nr:GNAT family N-acetyltransferase [Candidatus Rubrimentiphilum sp.]